MKKFHTFPIAAAIILFTIFGFSSSASGQSEVVSLGGTEGVDTVLISIEVTQAPTSVHWQLYSRDNFLLLQVDTFQMSTLRKNFTIYNLEKTANYRLQLMLDGQNSYSYDFSTQAATGITSVTAALNQVKVFQKGGVLQVTAPDDLPDANMILTNMIGQQMYTGKLGSTQQIQVGDVASGTYILSLQYDNKRITKRVAIAH